MPINTFIRFINARDVHIGIAICSLICGTYKICGRGSFFLGMRVVKKVYEMIMSNGGGGTREARVILFDF